MPSSTSSFERALPRAPWSRSVVLGLLVFAVFVALLELTLAAKGFRPTIVDSSEAWSAQRARASELGERALILIGASRMQLDIDLDTLREGTGRDPVQLAIDGSSFVPVLAGLAADPSVRGLVLVDFAPNAALDAQRIDSADDYQRSYASGRAAPAFRYQTIEHYLADHVRQRMRSFADGARPLSALLLRAMDADAAPQYLITLPDRSRLADYRLVALPDFYYRRVIRELGQGFAPPPGSAPVDLERALRAHIAQLPAADTATVPAMLSRLAPMVDAIRQRGGDVVFLALPTSGLVREIESRFHPRAQVWDRLGAGTGARTLHFEDDRRLAGFDCPDGSHLDFRDRKRFTAALVDALGLRRSPSPY